jgi:hypothetical protein
MLKKNTPEYKEREKKRSNENQMRHSDLGEKICKDTNTTPANSVLVGYLEQRSSDHIKIQLNKHLSSNHKKVISDSQSNSVIWDYMSNWYSCDL